MKDSQELIKKASEELNVAACRISEASVYLTESLLRQEEFLKHKNKYDSINSQLYKLRKKIEKVSHDCQKLPIN